MLYDVEFLGDGSMYDLYKSWEVASGHDFISFWAGAGIEDDEILALLPHVNPPTVLFSLLLDHICWFFPMEC